MKTPRFSAWPMIRALHVRPRMHRPTIATAKSGERTLAMVHRGGSILGHEVQALQQVVSHVVFGLQGVAITLRRRSRVGWELYDRRARVVRPS